jgi:hypothetical protein
VKNNEIYTAIALATFILISIVWKAELDYRRSLIHIKRSSEPITPPEKMYVEEIVPKIFVPDTTSKGYIGKRKPDGQNWSKKYGKNLLPMAFVNQL